MNGLIYHITRKLPSTADTFSRTRGLAPDHFPIYWNERLLLVLSQWCSVQVFLTTELKKNNKKKHTSNLSHGRGSQAPISSGQGVFFFSFYEDLQSLAMNTRGARVAATGSVRVAAEAKPQRHRLTTKCTVVVVVAVVTAVTPAQRVYHPPCYQSL